MEVLAIRPVNKGFVKCSVDVSLQTKIEGKEVPFIIRRISVFDKAGSRWISFPSEKYEKDGKKQFYEYALFKDVSHKRAFQDELFKILDSKAGGAEQGQAKIGSDYEQDDLPF